MHLCNIQVSVSRRSKQHSSTLSRAVSVKHSVPLSENLILYPGKEILPASVASAAHRKQCQAI